MEPTTGAHGTDGGRGARRPGPDEEDGIGGGPSTGARRVGRSVRDGRAAGTRAAGIRAPGARTHACGRTRR
ncbi:hypothetical protein Acsp06_53240 [Actinomycetospora sp. NBRC 106375]|nr:hypothetical protein Acsp06_53240 [Actinomycetospora sp. NBRC 106375]